MAGTPFTNTASTKVTDRSVVGPQPDNSTPTGSIGGNVPVGGIIMWSGAFADVPTNYALCDGTSGRPDLTDRFILGTNTEADVGTVGGTAQHKHAAGTLAGSGTSANDTAVTGAGTRITALGAVTGSTAIAEDLAGSTTDVLPPWYKLAFIIRTA